MSEERKSGESKEGRGAMSEEKREAEQKKQGGAKGTSLVDELLGSLSGDAPVRELHLGVFCTAVLSRKMGLSSTLASLSMAHGRGPHGRRPVEEAGSLHEKSARELAELLRSSSIVEAALGAAALNSLLAPVEERCQEINARDVLLERGAGRRVAVIGHFPFVEKLRAVAKTLWVSELQPHEQPGDVTPEQMEQFLPEADVVAMSGTTLLTQTTEELLRCLSPSCFTVMLGPTTPLTPLLFDYGVDVLCGTLVADPKRALAFISQGAIMSQIEGIRRVALWKEGAS